MMSGTFNSQSENNPDVAATAAVVQRGVDELPGMTVQFFENSRQFIQEYGAQVLDGHSPVNSPGEPVMGLGTGPIFDAGT